MTRVAMVVLVAPTTRKDMFRSVCHRIALFSQGSVALNGRFHTVYADDFAAVAAAYGVKKPFYAGW
jgi:ABC-type polysaccharide/polyol phosphate transport system ATPase subunit